MHACMYYLDCIDSQMLVWSAFWILECVDRMQWIMMCAMRSQLNIVSYDPVTTGTALLRWVSSTTGYFTPRQLLGCKKNQQPTIFSYSMFLFYSLLQNYGFVVFDEDKSVQSVLSNKNVSYKYTFQRYFFTNNSPCHLHHTKVAEYLAVRSQLSTSGRIELYLTLIIHTAICAIPKVVTTKQYGHNSLHRVV